MTKDGLGGNMIQECCEQVVLALCVGADAQTRERVLRQAMVSAKVDPKNEDLVQNFVRDLRKSFLCGEFHAQAAAVEGVIRRYAEEAENADKDETLLRLT